MNEWVKKWLLVLLQQAITDIKADRCNMSEEEASALMDALANIKQNKSQAASFVHLSESQFDNEVKIGRLSEGKKLYRGDNHKYWTKRELISYIKRWRNKQCGKT